MQIGWRKFRVFMLPGFLIRGIANSLVFAGDSYIYKKDRLVDYLKIQRTVVQTCRYKKGCRFGNDMLFSVNLILTESHFNLGVKYPLIIRVG